MRWWLSQTIVPVFKKLRILGWVRFRILRLAYKIFWWNSPRNGEWDFVLQWMRHLRNWQKPVTVLDVGCTESLLIYELIHRGYCVAGVDQRAYQEKPSFPFYQQDITVKSLNQQFDYIIAISTIEHIGLGAYGDSIMNIGDMEAMASLKKNLKPDGCFIITVPNKHLGTDTGRGYSYQEFENLIYANYKIIHYEERSNQICAVLVKS